MDNKSSWSSCTFELADIEIINHKTEHEEKMETWNCDQCNLFYLNKGLLEEHIIKKHSEQDIVKCKYCNKTILFSAVNRECFLNRKCETCEYKCSSCPQRFLRHSSLVNHEKKHSSPKKKRIKSNNKKNNPISAENNVVSKSFKRKLLEVVSSEEKSEKSKVKKNLNMKTKPKKTGNPQVKIKASLKRENPPAKKQKRLSSKTSKLAEEENSYEMSVKSPKRPTPKTYKTSDEKESSLKSKQTTSPTLNTNGLNCENSVNYKPFSCHVCGNTFASDSALLDHIKTHGENADKSFKCKFCGDEFDDIYKMQYHLAICPLAEDELDSSLKQVIPVNFPPKSIPGTPNQRKRGRPKKITEATLNQESSKDDPATLVNKKGSFRKRKTDVTENNKSLNIPLDSPPSKKLKKFQNKQSLPKSDSKLSRVVGEQVKTLLSDDMAVVSKESNADDIRKKLHHCPFPRCDFKFTREKALLCHMRNHSDDFDDSLKCHKCDIPFDDIHTLRLHINTCKGIKEEKDDDFKRLSCHESSPNRSFQRTKKDFVCHKCGRSYQNEDKLNRHLESCGSKFVCRICKDDFHNQHLLDEHFGSKHPPFTPYHCYSCDEDFISELFLLIHQSDEHGQNLSKTVHKRNIKKKDKVREIVPACTSGSFQETRKKTEPATIKCSRKNVDTINILLPKSESKIDCSPVASTTGKYSSRSNIVTSKCMNSTSQVFWCPICVLGFDDRNNMRVHLNEKHVVRNNSIYSCQICEVQMPTAEMMGYHLELHSINLLSVNRFSKLITHVKQNRMSEVEGLEMEIKCEKGSENEDFPLETINIKKLSKKRRTVKLTAQNKVASQKSSSQQNITKKSKHYLLGHDSSASTNNNLLNEPFFTRGSKIKGKNSSKPVRKNKLKKISVKDVPLINSFNEKAEYKHRNRNVTGIARSSRLLCLRENDSSVCEDDLRCTQKYMKGKKQKYKVEQNGSTKNKYLNVLHVKTDESEALEPIKVETTNTNSAVKPRPTVQQKNVRKFRAKKKIKTLHPIKATKTINILDGKQSNCSEDLINHKISLTNDEEEATLMIDDKTIDVTKDIKHEISSKNDEKDAMIDDKNINVTKDEGKVISNDNSMPEKFIECSSNNIEIERKDEQSKIEDSTNSEEGAMIKKLSANVKNKKSKNASGLLVDRQSEGSNKDLNSESNERSLKLVSQTSKVLISVTKECNELKKTRGEQSEDSIEQPVSGITDEQLTEVENECMQLDLQQQVCEETRSPKPSAAGDSDQISCTMCSKSFYNQDDLLDHLDTYHLLVTL